MPNCCVRGCKNSSYSGYLLKCFPKDPKRSAEWLKSIGRPDWALNNSRRICEVHFAPEMWEKTRVDGSRKLKYNAVPTVFGKDVVNKPSSAPPVLPAENANKVKEDSTPVERPTLFENTTLTNSRTLIKILPPNITNSTVKPIIIPAASVLAKTVNSAIIVNSNGTVVNSTMPSTITGGTSILKPIIKTTSVQSTPMLISMNADVLKNQIKVANNQKPIIIPSAKASILNPQVQTKISQATLVNASNPLPLKIVHSQPIVIPAINQNKSISINSEPIMNSLSNIKIANCSSIQSSTTQSVVETSANESTSSSTNLQEASSSKPSSIILNKAEAKKIKEERFAKMDKLLLKQLKLNNALRKKLNLMRRKMLTLMQSKSHKNSFLKDVFTEDQIRALELRQVNPKSITAWSQKTMLKALKLKTECGSNGYEELLRQHMPLPCIRTLNRWCISNNIAVP